MIIKNIHKIMNIRLGKIIPEIIIPKILSWIQPTLSSTVKSMDWHSVTWSPELSKFVAVADSGSGNRVMYSDDGIDWIQPTLSSSINSIAWWSVTWSPEVGAFVAVGHGTGNKVMYSVFE